MTTRSACSSERADAVRSAECPDRGAASEGRSGLEPCDGEGQDADEQQRQRLGEHVALQDPEAGVEGSDDRGDQGADPVR